MELMRLLRFMGYPINNFSTLELAMARQALAVTAAGGAALVAFDGVKRDAAVEAFLHESEALHTGLPNPAGAPLAGLGRYLMAADRLIRRFKPDVVHSYFGPSAGALNELALLHPRITFVRTIGSTPVASPRGSRFPRLRVAKWRLALRHQDAVVCVAPHIAEQLRGFGVDAARLHVIPNPTDLHRFTPRQGGKGDGPLTLVFLGRLEAVKNLGGLLRGFALAAAGLQPLRLRIYGEGPERPVLTALIRQLGLSDRVTLMGRTDDVPGALRQADAYVQASHHEGAPAAVGEAMAAGLPLLLSDIPAHRAMVHAGREGLLFPAQDPAALADAIRRLATDAAARERMGRQARLTAERELALERWVEREVALYGQLLHGVAPVGLEATDA
jgi:glycosyltransferase involved in cell wall biosynthesis